MARKQVVTLSSIAPALDKAVQSRLRLPIARTWPPGDREAVIETMNRYTMCIDARDWGGHRRLLAEDIAVDLSEVTGQPPSVTRADAFSATLAKNFAVFASTQHLVSNHLVAFGDGAPAGQTRVADCVCYLHAIHVAAHTGFPDPLHVGGRYTVHMVRQEPDAPWLLDRIGLEILWRARDWLTFGRFRNQPRAPDTGKDEDVVRG